MIISVLLILYNLVLLERLSQGLRIVKETGKYKAIYEKWFGALETPEEIVDTGDILRSLGLVF